MFCATHSQIIIDFLDNSFRVLIYVLGVAINIQIKGFKISANNFRTSDGVLRFIANNNISANLVDITFSH